MTCIHNARVTTPAPRKGQCHIELCLIQDTIAWLHRAHEYATGEGGSRVAPKVGLCRRFEHYVYVFLCPHGGYLTCCRLESRRRTLWMPESFVHRLALRRKRARVNMSDRVGSTPVGQRLISGCVYLLTGQE